MFDVEIWFFNPQRWGVYQWTFSLATAQHIADQRCKLGYRVRIVDVGRNVIAGN